MRHLFISCLMFFFWNLSFVLAQSSDNLTISYSTYLDAAHYQFMIQTLSTEKDKTVIVQKFEKLSELLAKHKHRLEKKQTSKKALRYLFYQTHKLFLKKYRTYSPENQFFKKGMYDCVSGSAWLAFVCGQAGYAVEIHETAFHVYLLVRFSEKDRVLLESTNGLHGFIDNEDEISILEKNYTFIQSEGKQPQHRAFNHIIDFKQLLGLQVYNQAIWHFNQQKFEKAQAILEDAYKLYQEDRIMALAELCAELLKHPHKSIVQQLQQGGG